MATKLKCEMFNATVEVLRVGDKPVCNVLITLPIGTSPAFLEDVESIQFHTIEANDQGGWVSKFIPVPKGAFLPAMDRDSL